MNTQVQKTMIEEILTSIDISTTAYEAAQRRYEDLSKWLIESPKSQSAKFNPHVYPQGSFRLGTVIRPLEGDEYDLDLSCKLQKGITRENYTQEQLKNLTGRDLEAYRIERRIEQKLEPKHRCWRLHYQDVVRFHLDTVPCIPANDELVRQLQERIINAGGTREFAEQVTHLAVFITDDRKPSYRMISLDWNLGNQEGYAQWFISRMKMANRVMESILKFERAAKVDDIPIYKWKTPLQRCVQILKRHRDIMFQQNRDGKPISAIITTLAAQAYQGENDIESALQNILSRMGDLVRRQTPRVPNPVNPVEDFADKWPTELGHRLKLEENFWAWLNAAKADFGALGSSNDVKILTEQAKNKFGAILNSEELKKKFGSFGIASAAGIGLAAQAPKSPVDHRGGGRFG